MKEEFRNKNFRDEALLRIDQCNVIITDYIGQGLRLTLRQLYYQLVSKAMIENNERSYRNLASLVSDARLAGLMDWDAIEDRGRQPHTQGSWDSIEQILSAAINGFRLDRWKNQPNYVELWVEKDALAGVLAPLGFRYHVTIMVNKGYSSQSAMYESASRFKDQIEYGKQCHLLYLGDHDPSGEDMVRDIRTRFEMFGADVDVTKIALTRAQITQYNPPPNPAKITDPRADAYIAKHGNSSWEVECATADCTSSVDQFVYR